MQVQINNDATDIYRGLAIISEVRGTEIVYV